MGGGSAVHVVTTTKVAPRHSASPAAHLSAISLPSDPSMPTTMRRCPSIASLLHADCYHSRLGHRDHDREVHGCGVRRLTGLACRWAWRRSPRDPSEDRSKSD